MASTRNATSGPNGKAEKKYPVQRFVTDFGRLITDVDRLVADLSEVTTEELASEKTNRNHDGHKLRVKISALRQHARLLTTDTLIHEFILELSRAHTLPSVMQVVRSYASRMFESPAGMIFIERNGQLRLAMQWQSNQLSKKYFSEERIRKGPVAHAFRTGAALFWSHTTASHGISHYLRHLIPGTRCGSVAFLPIRSGGNPDGVLALVVVHKDELSRDTREAMSRFAEMLSGSISRACYYDAAVAARSAAEKANKLQADFLSVISHELRNPMTPILNWAIALSSGRLPPDKQSFAVESIVRNIRALNYLIDDLFDVARISSGKLRLELAEIRIQDAAREALTATQQQAESKKLRITTDISEGIPPFLADPRRLRQVLINLLTNAVKFTPAGGSITVKVAKRENYVECVIKDTGKGITSEFLPFVFDRFRQENRSLKKNGTGLGLGLSIVREIVELHGGTVKAYSQGADHGSTFIFRLPLRTPKKRQKRKGRNIGDQDSAAFPALRNHLP